MKYIKRFEDVSATGGNDGAIMGGEVYCMGTDISVPRDLPSSTGDLVESPIDTGSYQDDSINKDNINDNSEEQETEENDEDKDDNKEEQNSKILNWDSYIKSKMNKITYLN